MVCGRNCWAFDDGENDPRGPLGDNALWTVESEDGYDLRTCAVCANDERSYRTARSRADVMDGRPLEWPQVHEDGTPCAGNSCAWGDMASHRTYPNGSTQVRS